MRRILLWYERKAVVRVEPNLLTSRYGENGLKAHTGEHVGRTTWLRNRTFGARV
jgi:hypothetical protein